MKPPFDFRLDYVQWGVIKTIPSEAFWIIFSCLSFFLLLSIYQSYKATIKARSLEDIPISKIRSAAQGWVVLEGTQHFYTGLPLIAPLSKRACTWYYYTVECYKKGGWVQIEQANSESLLVLNDGTGECIIDPRGATITPDRVDVWGGFQVHPSGKPKTWIGRLWGLFGHYRYKEYRMEDNDFIYVMGYFRTVKLIEAPDSIRNTYKLNPTEDSINLLTNYTADARQPYAISSRSKLTTINSIRRQAIMWSISYLTVFFVMCFALLSRL